MTIKRKHWVWTSLIAASLLQGCVNPAYSPNYYGSGQTQVEQTVRMGTVESVRAVQIGSNGTSGLGAIGGGALGAVAGSAIGGGTGSILTAIAGGIAGVVAGNAIEHGASTTNGLEITVRLDNGDLRAITQQNTSEVFRAGDRVRLLSAQGFTRVTH